MCNVSTFVLNFIFQKDDVKLMTYPSLEFKSVLTRFPSVALFQGLVWILTSQAVLQTRLELCRLEIVLPSCGQY